MACFSSRLLSQVLARARNAMRAHTSRRMDAYFVHTTFSRTVKNQSREMRLKHEAGERRYIEKLSRKMEKSVQETGVGPIPDCHFLTIDKPVGATYFRIMDIARASLNSVLEDSLILRYCEHYLKSSLNRPYINSLKRNKKKLTSIKMQELRDEGLESSESGVIALAVANACLVKRQFLGGRKEYEITVMFGYDPLMKLKSGPGFKDPGFGKVTEESVQEMIRERFLGTIKRRDGTPLEELVRRGTPKTAVLSKKHVVIHEFELIELDLPRATFRVVVNNTATMLNTVVNELGVALETRATITARRRTRCGYFRIEDAVPGDQKSMRRLGHGLVDKLVHANTLKPGCFLRSNDPFDLDVEVEEVEEEEFDKLWTPTRPEVWRPMQKWDPSNPSETDVEYSFGGSGTSGGREDAPGYIPQRDEFRNEGLFADDEISGSDKKHTHGSSNTDTLW
ncbi:tRNA pseudouridine synthase B [Porphyridium purpureum]|uniref:tRNA pseudouridine(55) synthase n=1 Tax=Porphyridium purpureum TaxID=35688 RepID=A0A5J4YTH3_PORPP|nr:tRNA pseudouridine synthase B [Porphyridium purpureum]|eukprot:POR4210..scf227_4